MEAVKCEAFLAAAELGSLTATAELLGYTQSGVTRMIGTLEEELGFPLFLRSKKGVQLTENGKLMLPLLREVVRAHHNAEQLSAEIGGVSKGSLTIGCYYSISALWMPEILTAFRARYPGVTVRMQEGGNLEMARWLNERSVDCCFGAQMHGDKYDCLSRRIGRVAAARTRAGRGGCLSAYALAERAVHPHLAQSRHRSGPPARAARPAPADLLYDARRLHDLQHGRGGARRQLQPAAHLA